MNNVVCDLSRSRKVALWFGCNPVGSITGAARMRREFSVLPERDSIGSKTIAVELSFPSGPMVQYALIGGSFIQIKSGKIELEINCIADTKVRFLSQIATNNESVFKGIPCEYIEYIAEEVDAFNKECGLLEGVLSIDCGAHGIYGSSPIIFRRATRLLLDLMTYEKSRDGIGSYLEEHLR